MAIIASAAGDGLTRAATYLDPTADWTRATWIYYPTPISNPNYYGSWAWADTLPIHTSSINANAYVELSTGPYIGQFVQDIEVDTPSTGFLYMQFPILTAAWNYVAFRYTALTTTLDMIINGVLVNSLTVDLSGVSPFALEAGAWDGNSTNPTPEGFGFDRIWQAALTLDQLYDESRSLRALVANNLLTDTPLLTLSNLGDLSGNHNDWVVTGALLTLTGPYLPTYTDQFVMSQIQNTMIEPADGGQTWPSELWTMEEVVSYLNQRQNRFLKNTHFQFGIANIAATSGVRTYDLPDDWINTIRVLWITSDGATKELTRSDLWEADNGIPTWSYVTATPLLFYDGGKPITIQLAPVPDEDATLQIHYVPYSALLDGSGELMTLPDEFVPAIKYGAMADMLTKVARTQDVRAQYCESRYAMGVEIAKLLVGGFK